MLYFVWAAALDNRSGHGLVAAALVTAGALVRIYAEETLLTARYLEYGLYAARTARVIPFVLYRRSNTNVYSHR